MAKTPAKPPKRKLKVFQAQLGFYDTVVAAPSRPAALRAWGVHQDLFAGGQARPAEDEAAIAAALEHPEVPLRRAVGSTDAFAVDAVSLPEVPDAPKTATAEPAAKAKARPAPEPEPEPEPEPDRTALDAAEAALKTLDAAREREEADLDRQQGELDAARDRAQSAYVASRKTASAAVVDARKAYRKAGGTP